MIGLVPHLPEVLPEALAAAKEIGWYVPKYGRAEALTELAPHLPESLLPEALEVARGIVNRSSRAEVLTGLS